MDAKQFLAEFGHIANAPGGVQRLRELIFELAINGKLIQNSLSSKSATNLLSEIQAFRSSLVQQDKLKRMRPLPDIDQAELIFDIPESWAFERLGNVCEIIRGVTFPASKKQLNRLAGSVACLRTGNIQREIEWGDLIYIDAKLVGKNNQWVESGDIMISMANSYELVGKVALVKEVKEIATFGGFIAAIRAHIIFPEYLYLVLRSPYMQSRMRLTSSQTTNIANISLGGLNPIPIPVPPLEEQSRIVAKVAELMALCDKLEAQQQKKRKLQNKLRQSVLQTVANAESPKELQDSWERLAGNFSHLFAEAVDVADFKGMILDLAVSGQLLKYDAIQTTGEELLSQIEEERLRWAAASKDQELKEAQAMIKKLKKQKVTFPDTSIPKHWTWATFLQVSQAVVDCHNKTAPYVNNGIHLVRTTDIRDGKMDLRNTKKITEETYAYWSRRMPPQAGDVFFTREAPMGEVAIVPEGEKVCLGQRTMLIRLFPDLFNNQFLTYVIQSPSFQKRMVEAAIGMTVKHLRVGGVEDLIIPVPPKHEQDKLVELIRDLFKKCDYFQNQLQRERRISAYLATTAIASLTGISTPQQEEPMKVPKTELKAPVRLGTAQPPSNMQAPLASLLARHNGEMGANDLWQRFGGEVDAFYAQLKTEVMHGWIAEPTGAQMLEKEAD